MSQPRIRTIKPEFFLHEELYDAEVESGLPLRLAFSGLWCHSDREGRFAWRPRKLGAQILPYDGVDFSRVLDALATRGFVVKYASGDELFGCVRTFKIHQNVNNRERASDIPDPAGEGVEVLIGEPLRRVDDASPTRAPRSDDDEKRNGNGNGTVPIGTVSISTRETGDDDDTAASPPSKFRWPEKIGPPDPIKAYKFVCAIQTGQVAPADSSLGYRLCALGAVLGEQWLVNIREAVRTKKPRPEKPWGYARSVAADGSREAPGPGKEKLGLLLKMAPDPPADWPKSARQHLEEFGRRSSVNELAVVGADDAEWRDQHS
ncbi:hypothetical protein [Botrimarina mediterranea]|uniref:hypothetical protein n=1 Tax=Botrimarina mediterranea TaxID=2528022 RepID=UPI0011897B12|nr:hypothetical protein K2D_06020 [Planctomycetes bacterium K2D]